MKFVLINKSTYRDTPFVLHRAGCADLKKRENRFEVKTPLEASSVDAAVESFIDDELREMGYSADYVDIKPCCHRA